jgi:hypothetical protein
MKTDTAHTPQAQMKAKLAQAGIAYKEISCYGRQIVVTSWSRDAADSWAQLLGQFAKVRAVIEALDERHDAKPGALGGRKYVPVFRTFAALEV